MPRHLHLIHCVGFLSRQVCALLTRRMKALVGRTGTQVRNNCSAGVTSNTTPCYVPAAPIFLLDIFKASILKSLKTMADISKLSFHFPLAL